MLTVYYYTTDDYNGMLISDELKAWDVSTFPQDGTIDQAKSFDISGLAGLTQIDDVASSIGKPLDLIDFAPNDYTTIVKIKTL